MAQDRMNEAYRIKTLELDALEQKAVAETQRVNECEKNIITAQNMARADRDLRRDVEAKLANAERLIANAEGLRASAERITALYTELHDANAIIFAARVAGNQVSITETEKLYQAYATLLTSRNATIRQLEKEIHAKTTAAAAAIAAKEAEAVVTMAAAINNAVAAVTVAKDAEAAAAMAAAMAAKDMEAAAAMAAKDAEITRLTEELAAARELAAMET
jgi:hypothetical protein